MPSRPRLLPPTKRMPAEHAAHIAATLRVLDEAYWSSVTDDEEPLPDFERAAEDLDKHRWQLVSVLAAHGYNRDGRPGR